MLLCTLVPHPFYANPQVLNVCLFSVLARIRYKILAASLIKDSYTPEKASQIILDLIQLDAEQYRLGKTKVQ